MQLLDRVMPFCVVFVLMPPLSIISQKACSKRKLDLLCWKRCKKFHWWVSGGKTSYTRDFFFFWGSPDGFSPNKHTMAAHMQCVCVSLVTIDDAWKASQIFRSDSLVVSQVRRWCDSQNQKVFNLHSQFLRSLTHARTSFPIDRNDIIISPQSTKSLHFYRTLLASLHGSDALFAWLDRQWTQKANTRNRHS